MALTTEQKASYLFKQSLGVAETSTLRDFFEENIKGRILVLNNQIWVQSDQIPATAPSLADGASSGVVQYFEARSMTAVAGVNNSFYLADLRDSIPFNFGDGSYNYVITSSTGTAIPFGQGDWLVNNTTGTLTFYGSVPANMPPKISFYKYTGAKGAGGEGSLPAVYVVATIAERDALTPKQGDLCVVTGENSTYAWNSSSWVLILAANSAPVTSVNTLTGDVVLTTGIIEESLGNYYFTDQRARDAVVINNTFGMETDRSPSVSAMKAYVAEQGAPVVSVNTLTGAVVLDTDDVSEGSLNQYFTDFRARQAAVVNSTAGSQTDQAPSVSAMQAYAYSKAGGQLDGFIQLNGQNEIRFADFDSSNYVGFKAPSTILSDKLWTLPAADGTSGQVLMTDGSGTLSWGSASATTGTLVHPTSESTFEFGKANASMTGISNTVIGVASGYSITSGQANTYFGGYCGGNTSSATQNSGFGYGALNGVTTGWNNTGIGSQSLNKINTGTRNAALGFYSGYNVTGSSSYNTIINTQVAASSITLSGVVAIGMDSSANYATASANDQFVLGTSNHLYHFPGVAQTSLVMGPTGTAAGSGGQIRFRELAANGTNSVALKAADSIAANITWTLPATDGTSGQVLSTNGSGTLSWTTGGGSLDPSQPITTSGYILNSTGINTQTSSYTLLASDNGRILLMNNSTDAIITVPTGLNVGFNCMIIRINSGEVTISAGAGVTLNNTSGLKIASQYGIASLIQYQTNIFAVSGYTKT